MSVAPSEETASLPSWSYPNCRAARAAGAAPVYAGQPGYGPHLDRDGDGIGCEPYRGR
ncbi:excalibur calcium-binding domain-containing protein [Sphingobium estronivorans]|uniref:excalibur calcium-binding domain-containing protein n=1 Tax=Sphingobium estronivorans TaxID=1577690 RepID=UPI00123C71A6|nr:excalibur calcium-binding domain-containing protein [Sphingobium estronivorans]